MIKICMFASRRNFILIIFSSFLVSTSLYAIGSKKFFFKNTVSYTDLGQRVKKQKENPICSEFFAHVLDSSIGNSRLGIFLKDEDIVEDISLRYEHLVGAKALTLNDLQNPSVEVIGVFQESMLKLVDIDKRIQELSEDAITMFSRDIFFDLSIYEIYANFISMRYGHLLSAKHAFTYKFKGLKRLRSQFIWPILKTINQIK